LIHFYKRKNSSLCPHFMLLILVRSHGEEKAEGKVELSGRSVLEW